MSQKLTRIWLLPVLLLASQTFALGLGDIRLSSALNEPLRAEIELLSATPEELANLDIHLASAETFARYGLDRPLDLDNLQFNVVPSGRTDGNVVQVRSAQPVSEPFITFLVEAVWSRGRLLREYTLLLDPPTFAPPPVAQSSQAVTAPSRAPQTDSGTIQRPAAEPPPVAPAPQQAPRPAPQPPVASPADDMTPDAPAASAAETPVAAAPREPAPQPPAYDPDSFDSTAGGDYQVTRGDTLWGIAQRYRPDNRLTMNQTMIAIFQANPEAFADNINLLSAGASLRIPSADDIFRISRGDALAEAQRQHEAWGGAAPLTDTVTQPSLTLVPPDDEPEVYDGSIEAPAGPDTDLDAGQAPDDDVVLSDEQRIYEIEQLLLDYQDSIIEIEDNELAALRAELARLRGEEYVEPAVDDLVVDDPAADDLAVDDETADIAADPAADDMLVDEAPDTTTAPPPRVAPQPTTDDGGLVNTVIGLVTGFWGILGGGLILVLGVLVWFARRASRGDDDDATGVWNSLDEDSLDGDSLASTEQLSAMDRDDETSFLVEEGGIPGAAPEPSYEATMEVPSPVPAADTGVGSLDSLADSDGSASTSMEDTFSSETAINLDQSDPIAEADFHMAYGLYDQAADLINGALAAEPQRQDLLGKLCEVYFVWGNRDAFVDAATRMQGTIGADESNADWDKIVIMGQQIAGDHEMFSGVSAGAATKAVDLSFDAGPDEASALDMEFGGPDDGADDVIDLGAATGESEVADDSDVIDLGAEFAGDGAADVESSSVDFMFDEPDTSASVTQEMPPRPAVDNDATVDAAVDGDSTTNTPTIEQQFESLESTGELPSLDDDATELANLDDDAPAVASADSTAEINLDDLGLDLGELTDSGLEALTDEQFSDLDDTAESQALNADDLDATGENAALADAFEESGTDLVGGDFADTTGMLEGLDEDDLEDTSTDLASGDITGRNPQLSDDDFTSTDTGIGIDTSLLDATGQTQILSADMAVETANDIGSVLSDDDKTMLAPAMSDDASLADDAETLLAPLDDDDTLGGDFDFAKTEALPKDVFTGNVADETNEMQGLAGSTDMDLDLDDLTAALKVSEMGDTVNQAGADATVEQPRIRPGSDIDLDVGMELGDDDDSVTAKIGPDDMTGDLHDARTMTEVGTKLDLARAYVDMGDPGGARSILEEVLDEGDEGQKQQAQQLLDSLSG